MVKSKKSKTIQKKKVASIKPKRKYNRSWVKYFTSDETPVDLKILESEQQMLIQKEDYNSLVSFITEKLVDVKSLDKQRTQ